MPDIHIVTVGDKRKFKAGARVALKAVGPTGMTDFEWLRDNAVLPDGSTNQYFLTMGPDTAGYYAVRATIGGAMQTSDAVRISVDEAATDSGRAGGDGGGTAPAEEPATYHGRFAFLSALVIFVLGLLLFAVLAFLASRILSDSFWNGLEGRLKIAVVLGLPATIVGILVILVGLWMATVEWRGRLKKLPADARVAATPSPGDVKEIIAAVGNLRGAALAMVVGAILMLGTAWVAQSAAGTTGSGGTVAVPAATPARTSGPASTTAPTAVATATPT